MKQYLTFSFVNKIAFLSDIHANLPAFSAVLRDVQICGVERIVFLGDIVGDGASPAFGPHGKP